MPTRLPRDCWVCGKPLGSVDYWLDEFGFAVHPECYNKLIDEKLSHRKVRPRAWNIEIGNCEDDGGIVVPYMRCA